MPPYSIAQKTGFIAGPLLFLLIYNLPFQIINPAADAVIAIAAWMVIWWITETVSITITALIPLTFFPLLQISDIKTVAASYGSPIVFLFFGGFVMALALEKVNLHQRIALNIIRFTGTSANRVILGFMLATAFLSMWISNTATTVVMLPIGLSVVKLLISDEDGFTKGDRNFALSLMLGIAYAANVGGIATIIGTPPNTIMVGFVENEYKIQISFLNWMLIGVPFSSIMLGFIYLILVKLVYPNGLGKIESAENLIDQEIDKLGPLRSIEKRVLLIFVITMGLWITRIFINGWLPNISLTDTGISLLATFALFAIPFNFRDGKYILGWKDTAKLPWGILLLFGGGLALASALSEAGVIKFIGDLVAGNNTLSISLVMLLLITIMLFMTELMSNVALVAVFAPVVAGVAIGLDQELLLLLIPVTMASSCAFMLPMATPPNAIVFASGHIKVQQMVRAGFILNIGSVALLWVFGEFIIPMIF